MSCLVVITQTFPFEGVTERAFMEPEIGALSRRFDRVVIAPLRCVGQSIELPANVEIDRSLTSRPTALAKLQTLLLPSTWRQINNDGRYIHSMRQLRGALAETAYVRHFRKALEQLIVHHRLDLNHTLFYCFWFDFMASALSGIEGVRFISRAHGFDVYDSRVDFRSHTRREETLQRMTACYPASDAATDYLRTDYPEAADKISTRPLGSCEANSQNPGCGNQITVLSVGRCAAEKGIDRLAMCMKMFAERNPAMKIRWIHVGDGPQFASLRAADYGPLTVDFKGELPNGEVNLLMESEPITFFALLSRSEGGRPVAIAEALAHGIPVVAADVGGIGELVDGEVGILLSPTPVPAEFCQRVEPMIERFRQMRLSARKRWEERCDARLLREKFAREIRELMP